MKTSTIAGLTAAGVVAAAGIAITEGTGWKTYSQTTKAGTKITVNVNRQGAFGEGDVEAANGKHKPTSVCLVDFKGKSVLKWSTATDDDLAGKGPFAVVVDFGRAKGKVVRDIAAWQIDEKKDASGHKTLAWSAVEVPSRGSALPQPPKHLDFSGLDVNASAICLDR